jgi:hypothetical protein
MKPVFDGYDEARYTQEAAELRRIADMSWDARPLALFIDGEWQLWWQDARRSAWFYLSEDGVVQKPLTGV